MTPDSPLYFLKLIPPRIRLWVYVIASFCLFALGVWQAIGGSLGRVALFIVLLMSSIVHTMSGLNVPDSPKEVAKND